jgi:hypothetical protein
MHRLLYLLTGVWMLALPARPAAALQPFYFYNPHTTLCLGPQNDSMAQGTPIVQETCKASGAQQWIYVPGGSDNFQIQNALTGLCLDARGGAANHTPVQQWPCSNISNEEWEVFAPAKGSVVAPLKSRVAGSSTFCLDIPGGQTTVGLAMQIYGCNGTVSQLWQLKPAPDVFVPFVANLVNTATLNAAFGKITLYGLMPKEKDIPNCFAGHTAFIQGPNGGTFAPANSTVTLTVYTCTKPGT